MLNEQQTVKVLKKMKRFISSLKTHIFVKAGELGDIEMCPVDKSFHDIPDLPFKKAQKGALWGGEGTYCWFRSEYTVPEELAGKTLFLHPDTGGYEALLFVDEIPFGAFNSEDRFCDMIKLSPEAGEKIKIALECYAGSYVKGTEPFQNEEKSSYMYTYNGIDVCVKDYEAQELYFDLLTLYQLTEVLPKNSFRKAEVVNALVEVYNNIDISFEDSSYEVILEALRGVVPIIKKALSAKNGDSAPSAAIIGHSHMDTAWLWHVGETVKKCARTYSNQLSFMQQYPEYKFIQSSACHGNMIRKYYPRLFAGIQKAVAEGKYEPNGGVWVECDCNITSGESVIRQFLWGQRFTRKYFNYTSNCFWLPDTFGYSAAIPQIMKGCLVDYFLTTKISWNDTNKFPYDTFYWQGIDGTKVFTHFNTIHHYPDPKDAYERIDAGLSQKGVNNKRLLAYGFGDGGGGPIFEMIEAARRCKNLEGCAKMEHKAVGDFMKELENSCVNPNTYKGELYLELHRGTLTNQHTIKRNNRKAELALRNLEFFTVYDAAVNGKIADGKEINPLYETLLLNQFHDILPGTCINRVHVESRAETTKLIQEAHTKTKALIKAQAEDSVTVINTLSFERNDALFLHLPPEYMVEGNYRQQRYKNINGEDTLMVAGVKIPAFSSVTLKIVKGELKAEYAFSAENDALNTPIYKVKFAENGTIASLFDKRASRQIVDGENFNTFVMAEDVPNSWDNWDVDGDIEAKFKNVSVLLSHEVISVGVVAYIIRNKYKISEKSTVLQDMIFFADSSEIRFDTLMDWKDNHRFLKVAFDTGVKEDFARHEIQFGYVKRPTTRNTSVEQAKFEVVNHKYSDISESRYGVAVLNDCKYGISAKGGRLRLSLHKGGNRPDIMGDKDGQHRCVYSVLPHNASFGAESVIKPAYMLNIPVIETKGSCEIGRLAYISADNCFIETIKPCEDAEKAFILRIYEAEGTYTVAKLHLFAGAKKAALTNMLEEEISSLEINKGAELTFNPFEIKTVKVYY